MAKQSGYLQRWENETNRLLQATIVITSQYDIDTLQIAIHQSEGWGYVRWLCEYIPGTAAEVKGI